MNLHPIMSSCQLPSGCRLMVLVLPEPPELPEEVEEPEVFFVFVKVSMNSEK